VNYRCNPFLQLVQITIIITCWNQCMTLYRWLASLSNTRSWRKPNKLRYPILEPCISPSIGSESLNGLRLLLRLIYCLIPPRFFATSVARSAHLNVRRCAMLFVSEIKLLKRVTSSSHWPSNTCKHFCTWEPCYQLFIILMKLLL